MGCFTSKYTLFFCFFKRHLQKKSAFLLSVSAFAAFTLFRSGVYIYERKETEGE